jgi:alkanesulfonate monooxygenase SsuD/methylene tetrahydromethanopterin reductase-like flavin-dependent oxidoreductase (luciferase family)
VLPIAGAIAATTTRVRIGTFLVLLPLHNPVRVAEDVATVDVISNGRFDLGVGQGYARGEFAGYGIERKERSRRLEEGLEILRGAWMKEGFSYSGKCYRVEDVTIMPRPVQLPHPPLWVGARGPKAIERAARHGCHFMGLGDPTAQATYDEALRRAGRNPADFFAAQGQWVYVAANADEAWRHAGEHFHYMLHWYGRWLVEASDFAGDEQLSRLPPPEKLRDAEGLLFTPVIGSPDEVATVLRRTLDRVRTTHLVVGMHFPGLDPERSRRSMELFAREVMPRLQGA